MARLSLIVSQLVLTAHAQFAELDHRRLDYAGSGVDNRHNAPPPLKHPSVDLPMTKDNHLMSSKCRIGKDGFFGSTGGTPVLVEYGFELETMVNANVDRILDVIDERVMDDTLAFNFPDLCGVPSRRFLAPAATSEPVGRVTGFQFGVQTVENTSKLFLHPSLIVQLVKTILTPLTSLVTCEPVMLSKNECNYYKSMIKIFGVSVTRKMVADVLSVVQEAVQLSFEDASANGAVRIDLATNLTKILVGPQDSGAGRLTDLSVAAKAGFGFALGVIFIGLAVIAYFCAVDANHYCQQYKGINRKTSRRTTRYRHRFESSSLTHTYQAETESDVSEKEELPVSARPSSQKAPTKSRQARRPKYSDPGHLTKSGTTAVFAGQEIILEFGPSFDPERDRHLVEMEEESSCAPDYADYKPEHSRNVNLRIIQDMEVI